jgi:hypothetical protein
MEDFQRQAALHPEGLTWGFDARLAWLPDESGLARYHADGLFGLAQTGQTATYDAIVWKLALHIQRIHQSFWVEPLVPRSVEGLRSSF